MLAFRRQQQAAVCVRSSTHASAPRANGCEGNENLKRRTRLRLTLVAVLTCPLSFSLLGASLALDATLISLDSQNFPFIYLTVAVEQNGSGISTLGKANFLVTEDAVLQTDYFDVIPPDTGGGVRTVDVVFLMDNSGSMGVEQASVRANVQAFVDALEDQGVDYRLGLCRFGALENGGNPIIEDGGALTPDADYFKNDVWERNVDDGYDEPGWDALFDATIGFAFRGGAQKVFILITDECVTHPGDTNYGDVSYAATLNALQAGSITMFALINLAYENSIDDYGTMAQTTNGQYFDIYSALDDILAFISSQVANTYRITYRSSNDVFDGIVRHVLVQVLYQGDQATCQGTYTPGSAPRIRRTQDTLNLHDRSWAAGTTLTIRAEITDTTAPLVQDATLYYRRTGDTAYATAAMAHSSDIWTGTIPGAAVGSPGVDYYLSAADGVSTSTNPTVDPRTRPHQLAVLPNVAPAITHTPVAAAAESMAVPIAATIVDNTNTMSSARLWYRSVGQLIYQTNGEMAHTGGDTYEDTIPVSAVTAASVEYYIHAEDDLGVGSSHGTLDNPHLITVTSDQPPTTTIESATINESSGSAAFTWSGTDDQTPSGSLVYSYRLLGKGPPDSEWSSWGSGKTKTYSGLSAGSYEFQVRAKDTSGAIDSSPASRSFAIERGEEWGAGYWARVTNTPLGIWSVRKGPGTAYSAVRRVPNDWMLWVVSTHDDLKATDDGFVWWEVADTLGSSSYWIAAKNTRTTQVYLVAADGGAARTIIGARNGGETIPTDFRFDENRTLTLGMVDDRDIRYLQMLLGAEGPTVYPERLVTGYYGELTKAAVARFQSKYNLSPAQAGVLDGPTAQMLNFLIEYKFELEVSRAAVAHEAVDHYYTNRSSAPSLYSGDDNPNRFSSVFGNGRFPKSVVLAVIAHESKTTLGRSGPSSEGYGISAEFDNALVTWDGGYGLMQITTPSFRGQGCGLSVMEEEKHVFRYVWIANASQYRPEYWSNFYGNTRQGIYANIKDGMRVLQDYATTTCCYDSPLCADQAGATITERPASDLSLKLRCATCGTRNSTVVSISGTYQQRDVVISCDEFGVIDSVWRFNGRVRTTYLSAVANELPLLGGYFGAYGAGDSTWEDRLRFVNSKNAILIRIHSNAVALVKDSQGRVVGLANGDAKEDIPFSAYNTTTESASIAFAYDSYTYQVSGISKGGYGLTVALMIGDTEVLFEASAIPTDSGALHQYTIDWDALARGEDGVTLQVDHNGDGEFERTILTGSTLSGTTTPIAPQPPRVSILAPIEDEPVVGWSCQLQWQATSLDHSAESLVIGLSYSADGGTTWITIAAAEENDGTYTWDISNLPGGEYWLRAVATDPDGGSSEVVRGPFTIITFKGSIIVGPNPVTGIGTAFFYRLPSGASRAELMIFNTMGRTVFELSLDVGSSRFPETGTWDPVDMDDIPLANGPYVYVLIADGRVIGQGKMVIQR